MAGNGKLSDDPVDPAIWVKSQMAMALRQIEAAFPGCHITVFIADSQQPDKFNYMTSAPAICIRQTLDAFLKEAT